MSDLTTPQEILNLVETISVDRRSSGRRYRVLRGMVKCCFSRHPHLLDFFVEIKGVEALVSLSLSSRPSAKHCGEGILRLLHKICFDLEQPRYGIRLMIELCKMLSEEHSIHCRLFLACTAIRWMKDEESLFLKLVTDLFKSVDSIFESHMKDPQLQPEYFELRVLEVFSSKFNFARKQITENLDITQICNSLMEKMSILLPGFRRISLNTLFLYLKILGIVYRSAECGKATDEQQEFRNFLTDRADIFREMILMLLAERGNSWVYNHGWLVQFMVDVGLEADLQISCASSLLPAIDESTTFRLLIDRDNLLDSSKGVLNAATLKQLQGTLEVTFDKEMGYGEGLVREWFVLVAEQLLKQDYFVSLGCDMRRILPSQDAIKESDRMTYFFAGQFIALAMMHNIQLGITFDRILYLAFAGKAIGLEDFKDTDPERYLKWKEHRENVEDGDDVEESIYDFIESMADKTEELLEGYTETTSPCPRTIFFRGIGAHGVDAFLLGDTEDISVTDWMNHTKLYGYNKADPQIDWFWKVVNNLSPENRRDLLFFWTAIKFLPPGGFKGLKTSLCISKWGEEEGRLPSASTCCFLLKIPAYPSLQVLQERIQSIIGESFCFDIE